VTAVASSTAEEIRAVAARLGFVAAWAPAALPGFVGERYAGWLAAGRHAMMGELLRGVDVRLDATQRFGWARSALVLALPHAYPEPAVPDDDGVRIGRVGRVFWVREQAFVERLARPAIDAVKQALREAGHRARDWIDQGPLPLRSHAAGSGLGWIGRSGMLVSTALGTATTLAVLLTDVEVEPPAAHPDRCGTCRRCVDRCPTGALLGDGTLDARRCVSYWTTQHPGLVPAEAWAGIGDWVFGCDVCQQVCPWNARAEAAWVRYVPDAELAHPDLRRLLAPGFERVFAGSAFERAGRSRLARNALIVLANAGEAGHLPLVRSAAGDADPVVRATAAHALARLGDRAAADRLRGDPDATVAREAAAALGDVAS